MDELGLDMEELSITSEETSQAIIVTPIGTMSKENLNLLSTGFNSAANDVGGFGFVMSPARKLSLAIKALADPLYNPAGSGRMDMDDTGFRVTAINGDLHGSLFLSADGLDNFNCQSPFEGKMFDLKTFAQNLDLLPADEDTITFVHHQRSDHVCVFFGNHNASEKETALGCDSHGFAIHYSEIFDQVPKFPRSRLFSQAVGSSDYLNSVIDKMVSNKQILNLVQVEMMANEVRITQHDEHHDEKFDDDDDDKKKSLPQLYEEKVEDNMLTGQHLYQTWLYWPYPEVLRTAATLSPTFGVGFITENEHRVCFAFSVTDEGRLIFLKNAARLIKTYDEKLLHSRQETSIMPLPKMLSRPSRVPKRRIRRDS